MAHQVTVKVIERGGLGDGDKTAYRKMTLGARKRGIVEMRGMVSST